MALDNSKNESDTACEMENVKDPDASRLKLDAHGVPLVPQPSDHKDDPLVGITLSPPLCSLMITDTTSRIGTRYINTMCSSCYVYLRLPYNVRANIDPSLIWLVLTGTVGAGMVPPTFGTLAKKFHVTNQQASYFTTSYILFTGVIPLLVTPFVNIYGRRPAYLVGDPYFRYGWISLTCFD